MIIRPACTGSYTTLPNSIFNDRRLSADTRAMLAWVLSKPKNWDIRPPAVAKALSRSGGKPLGRTRLSRIFDEAIAAGYMARSAEQTHHDDGTFGKYVYVVGLPEDVTAAVKRLGIAVQPCAQDPHAADPRAANVHTNHKRKNLENNKSTKIPLCSPTASAEQTATPFGCSTGSKPVRPAERPPSRRPERPEVIQNRIAQRLGSYGWIILGTLTATELDQLTAQERSGSLGEYALAKLRARSAPYASLPTRPPLRRLKEQDNDDAGRSLPPGSGTGEGV